mgnify:CR=1 FL=1|jgi:hypothetical protein
MMPLLLPFGALVLGGTLLSLSSFLNEELLLLLASTLFFGTVFSQLRGSAASWLEAQADELYGSLGALLELRLLRLAALLGLGRRLLGSVRFLDRLLLSLVPLFYPLPAGGFLPLLGSLRRDLEALPSLLDRLAQRRRLRALAVLFGDFSRVLGDRLALTP